MWVSKRSWERLQERVKELEEWKRSGDYHFTVYKKHPETSPNMPYPYNLYIYAGQAPYKTISAKDVIAKICDRLGIELVYEEGKPDSVVVKDKPKASK